MPQKRKISLFNNGQFVGICSQDEIEVLVACGLATVEKNTRGYIVRADRIPPPVKPKAKGIHQPLSALVPLKKPPGKATRVRGECA